MYVNALFNLSKLMPLNSFSDTNIFSDINFSSHVITMFIYDKMLLLKIVVDKIYCHLL